MKNPLAGAKKSVISNLSISSEQMIKLRPGHLGRSCDGVPAGFRRNPKKTVAALARSP
jgi:hypothetical protein